MKQTEEFIQELRSDIKQYLEIISQPGNESIVLNLNPSNYDYTRVTIKRAISEIEQKVSIYKHGVKDNYDGAEEKLKQWSLIYSSAVSIYEQKVKQDKKIKEEISSVQDDLSKIKIMQDKLNKTEIEIIRDNENEIQLDGVNSLPKEIKEVIVNELSNNADASLKEVEELTDEEYKNFFSGIEEINNAFNEDWMEDPEDILGPAWSKSGVLEITKTEDEWNNIITSSHYLEDDRERINNRINKMYEYLNVKAAIHYKDFAVNSSEYKVGKAEASKRGEEIRQYFIDELKREAKAKSELIKREAEQKLNELRAQNHIKSKKGVLPIKVDIKNDIGREVLQSTINKSISKRGYLTGSINQKVVDFDHMFDYYKKKMSNINDNESPVNNNQKRNVKVRIKVKVKDFYYLRMLYKSVRLDNEFNNEFEQAKLVAKMFQELVSNTPMDENYTSKILTPVEHHKRVKRYVYKYEEVPDPKSSTGTSLRKVKVFLTDEEALSAAQVTVTNELKERKHKADEKSVRGDWLIKYKGVTYKAFDTESEDGNIPSYDYAFSKEDFIKKDDEAAINKIAKAFSENIKDKRNKKVSFEPWNVNPRWQLLEFGGYKKASKPTVGEPYGYKHGVLNHHSYQAPYGFTRLQKLNFESIVANNGLEGYMKTSLDVSRRTKDIRALIKSNPELKKTGFNKKMLVKVRS